MNEGHQLARRLHLVDSWGLTGWGLALWFTLGLSVVLTVLFASIILGSRAIGRTTCRHWSEQTGYPSKFRILNFFDTGTCLARTPSGRWVLNSKVLTFTGRKP